MSTVGDSSPGREIGRVDDYFAKVGVIGLRLGAPLAVGDQIRVRGHTTDFSQQVKSMQIEHESVEGARRGAEVGIKVGKRWGIGVSSCVFARRPSRGDRPIMETIANLIYSNFFGRFPNINVASVENGAIWVPYLLEVMDNMKGMGRNGPWPNGYVSGKPSEVFKQRVFVSPHHFTEDIGALMKLVGPTQILFGSDFPHSEGMSGVDDYRDRTAELVARADRPDDEIRLFLRDNALRLLGLDN